MNLVDLAKKVSDAANEIIRHGGGGRYVLVSGPCDFGRDCAYRPELSNDLFTGVCSITSITSSLGLECELELDATCPPGSFYLMRYEDRHPSIHSYLCFRSTI
jgi:hypothetical protein